MTLEAVDCYRDLAYRDHSASSWALLCGSPNGVTARREVVEKFAHLVKFAIGCLGVQVSPYLDESLLVGRGLMTLFEMAQHQRFSSPGFEALAAGRIVEDLRRWARATDWFRSAWCARTEPLCTAVERHGPYEDDLLARELGLRPHELKEHFAEAGLVFGASPERMIPVARVNSAQRGRIASVIADLPAPHGTLLTLYFKERLSFPEIAELLDLPPAQVQMAYARAAIAIRAAVTKQAVEE